MTKTGSLYGTAHKHRQNVVTNDLKKRVLHINHNGVLFKTMMAASCINVSAMTYIGRSLLSTATQPFETVLKYPENILQTPSNGWKADTIH